MFGHCFLPPLDSVKKREPTFIVRVCQNRRGATFVDYLMITAVVAGVALPIAMKYLLEPINTSLLSQRQNLVSFLAQDRKQNVPNAWFSQEQQGEPGGKGDLPPVKDLSD